MLCVAALLLAATAAGCHKNGTGQAGSAKLTPSAELGPVIGSLAAVVQPAPVAVEGYGLVGGLPGTGSADCPPEVRAYLKQYILTQWSDARLNVDELIDSKNTVVLRLEGSIPPTPSTGEHFDVRAALAPGSTATSIRGGWLFKAELRAAGTFGVDTRPLATVEGPVFINTIGTVEPDTRSGYVLGGGQTAYEYAATLRLRRPDYRMASRIRNRLSERYGPNIARAVSAGEIEVRIPPEYRWRKTRFISMIPATFMEVTEELTKARISTYVRQLAASGEKENSEVVLEAIGRESLTELGTLLNAPDAEVRLRAGRCMLALGDDRGLPVLRDLATDPKSAHRREALDAIMVSARRADAAALARRLLRDDDVTIVLAACEHLRRIDDAAMTREVIGGRFFLEQVAQSRHKAIYVTRSGDPRVVLFGAPLPCRDSLFVESPDKGIVLDSRKGQDYVSVIRRHPTRPGVVGPIRTGSDVADLVRTLGSEPVAAPSGQLQGLGVPYAEVIAVLEQLSAKEGVAAQFWAGPLPKIGLAVKK